MISGFDRAWSIVKWQIYIHRREPESDLCPVPGPTSVIALLQIAPQIAMKMRTMRVAGCGWSSMWFGQLYFDLTSHLCVRSEISWVRPLWKPSAMLVVVTIAASVKYLGIVTSDSVPREAMHRALASSEHKATGRALRGPQGGRTGLSLAVSSSSHSIQDLQIWSLLPRVWVGSRCRTVLSWMRLLSRKMDGKD